MVTPVILSGGNGTRLWPLSCRSKPKQFVKVLNNETMFTQTVKRFQKLNNYNDIIILGNINHKKLIEEEIKNNKLKNTTVFLEPKAMNTAPAIGAVVNYMVNNNRGEEIVVFCPSDAYINDSDIFIKSLLQGEKEAEKGKVVCFGIQPLYPETGYGYIKLGNKLDDDLYEVDRFVEKPNIEKAIQFLKDGNYLWNGGIFMAKASVLYDLFKKHQKRLFDNLDLTLKNSRVEESVVYLNKDHFENCEEISIDYAVIENLNSNNLATVPLRLIWSDLGSYKSLFDIDNEKTKNNNVSVGKVIVHNTENCFISSKNKIVCCSDVDDLVIIEENDVILIMKKDKSQNVKKIIEKLKDENLEELL